MLDTLTVTSNRGNVSRSTTSTAPARSRRAPRRPACATSAPRARCVLLNGRRLPTYPLPDFQDLRQPGHDPARRGRPHRNPEGGGSAIYGSDAIAGVINIITRTRTKDSRSRLPTRASLHNGRFGERTEGSSPPAMGNYDKDGYNLFGSVEFFERDPQLWSSVAEPGEPALRGPCRRSFGTHVQLLVPRATSTSRPSRPAATARSRAASALRPLQRFEAVPATPPRQRRAGRRLRISDKMQWHGELQLSSDPESYISANPTTATTSRRSPGSTPNTGQLNPPLYERGLPVDQPVQHHRRGREHQRLPLSLRRRQRRRRDAQHELSLPDRPEGHRRDWDYDTAIGVMGGHTKDRWARRSSACRASTRRSATPSLARWPTTSSTSRAATRSAAPTAPRAEHAVPDLRLRTARTARSSVDGNVDRRDRAVAGRGAAAVLGRRGAPRVDGAVADRQPGRRRHRRASRSRNPTGRATSARSSAELQDPDHEEP